MVKRIKIRTKKRKKKESRKLSKLRAYGEAIQFDSSSTYEVPEGLTVGKPFKTLSLGQVSSRMSGDAIGKEIDETLISDVKHLFHGT